MVGVQLTTQVLQGSSDEPPKTDTHTLIHRHTHDRLTQTHSDTLPHTDTLTHSDTLVHIDIHCHTNTQTHSDTLTHTATLTDTH